MVVGAFPSSLGCSHWGVIVVQLLNCVWLFATPWTAARQASLSFTISQSLLKPMSTELMMPSNHLILCCLLFLLPSIFPSITVFSNESALRIMWPKDRSFSFSISPCSEYSGLIPLRIDWFDLLFEESSLEKRTFTIWTMSYFPQTHWGHWSCLPLSNSYTFPSKESLSGCSGRRSGSSKIRPQCLVECSPCPLHSTALPTSMATIISIMTAKLMSQALGLHKYHLIQSSYNTGTRGKYNIIPTLQRRKRRLRKHRSNLASDAMSTLTSEVICLTSYLTTTPKDLLFSGIGKQETWGHIGKKQDLQRGNFFFLEVPIQDGFWAHTEQIKFPVWRTIWTTAKSHN